MNYDHLLDIMAEQVPDDFYYDAWGSQFLPIGTDENFTNYNYVGGVPLVTEDHEWPTCEEHGPLLHFWSTQDIETKEIVQCFVCAEVKSCEISVNYDCSSGVSSCGPHDVGYICRRIWPTDKLKPAVLPEGCPDYPRCEFKWVPIRLLDRKRINSLPTEHDFYRFGEGVYMHSDTICNAEMEESGKIEKDHFLLHCCKGIPSHRDKNVEKFGYFITLWAGAGIRFYPWRNTVHLHMNRYLVMKWVEYT